MAFKKSYISLKKLLVISLALLVIFTGGVITTISYISSRKLGYEMASSLVKLNTENIGSKIKNYLDETVDINKQIEFLIKKENIDLESNELTDYIYYNLVNNPEYAGIYFASINGEFSYFKRMENGSISYREIEVKDGVSYSKWIHYDESYRNEGFENSVYPTAIGYNPHVRTWYKDAIKEKKNIWSKIYKFASDNKPGITNSQPVYINGELQGVVGIDLALDNISNYLKDMDISTYGSIMIINDDFSIIASSTDLITSSMIEKAYKGYMNKGNRENLTLINYNEENYIVNFSYFKKSKNINWKIVLVFPENHVLGVVNSSTTFIILIAVILIMISTVIGIKIANDISKPINSICSDMKKMCNLDLDGGIKISSDLKEIIEIDRSFVSLKQGIKSFSKYVPSKLVARLFEMGREAVLGGERRIITVMFTDIADFTAISENMDPEYLVDELAEYLDNISRIIHHNSGTVDKYIGDSIMAFWNAPEDVKSHAALACNAAIQIQKYLEEYKNKNPQKIHFKTRIGINTGEVLVGNIGCEHRMNYTVMGDNINLGSRLESLNREYGTKILISKNTKEMSGKAFTTRAIDKVKVKGRTEETYVYELIGYNSQMTPDFCHFLNLFNNGVGNYFKLYLDESLKFFNDCLEINPEDIPTRELLKKVESLKSRST